MSVTFYPGKKKEGVINGEWGTYWSIMYPEGYNPEEIQYWLDYDGNQKPTGSYKDGDCPVYVPNPWEMNVANGNADYLLGLVGFSRTDEGFVHITDMALLEERLRSTLAAAKAMPAVAERPTHETTGEGGCRMVYCGYSADSVIDRLSRLLEITQAALLNGADAIIGA